MITDKLRKLGEYIEKIDSIKPIEFLESNMKKIEKELRAYKAEQLELGEEFKKDIFKVMNKYSKVGIPNSVVLCELYNVLISFSRKSMIEEQANLLGIDGRMYKDEVNLLFKGKSI